MTSRFRYEALSWQPPTHLVPGYATIALINLGSAWPPALALMTIEGQIVQPLLVGQRLELNPIMVFLVLWVGG